jgi:hypothetical protein
MRRGGDGGGMPVVEGRDMDMEVVDEDVRQ